MRTENGNGEVALFIYSTTEDVPWLFILDDILGGANEVKRNLWNLFQGEAREMDFGFLRVVNDPAQADFFLLPHNYFALKKIKGTRAADDYISGIVKLAESHRKKILVCALADTDERIDIPHAFVFRYGQYGYNKKENEIIIPPYTEPALSPDLMEYRAKIWKHIVPRDKKEKPTVGFCGWADFPNVYRMLTHKARVVIAYVRRYLMGDTHAIIRLHGMYWRRKALNALYDSPTLETAFILRRSYAAQKGRNGDETISGEDAEKEYIHNILDSDFVLAPRGNANASIRFFEALSLGRIPVLIDTDCILPLADKIRYEDFTVIVPHDDIRSIGKRVLKFYDSLSNEEFRARQRMARSAFEALRPDAFLKAILPELKRAEKGSR